MQNQTRHGNLNQEALSSVIAFKTWLSNNLGVYKFKTDKEDIPSEDLLIYLNYIEEKVREYQEEIDKVFWLQMIKELRRKINIINNEEQENSGEIF